MAHYVLEGSPSFALSPTGGTAISNLSALSRGACLVDPPVEPLEFALQRSPTDVPPPLLDQAPAPVMRDDLLETLRSLGIDNIESYPAILGDPHSGRAWTNFVVTNVIGLVSAVDRDGSKFHEEEHQLPFFESLVLDDAAAAPHDLFRLSEMSGLLIVSQRVKHALERAGFAEIAFFGPGEWSG